MRRKIDIIPNSAPRPSTLAHPQVPDVHGRWRIIGLGRLAREKGFNLLIAAFGLIAARYPGWDLTIFGEGDQRSALEEQITSLGLGERISLPGLTRLPEAELVASHLMVLPSYYEGFPNALAEAVAAGLPTVAFSGISGVEELIEPEHTGLLVDPAQGIAGLAAALNRLMGDDNVRGLFGAAAQSHASRWVPETVHGRWEELLTTVVEVR
jgi:glycosyltransferase involved in cell wall biosynthesis